MNKFNRILSLILIVQVALGVVIYWPHSESKSTGATLLADFNPDKVTTVRITDSNNRLLVLSKDSAAGNWVLSDYGNYVIQAGRVETLLENLKDVRTNRLITQSSTSHRRLKVSPDDFVRMVEVEQADGPTYKLYVGNAQSGSASYVRLDGQDNVYMTSNLTDQDVTTQVSRWIDTLYVNLPLDQATNLTLQNANGTFEFVSSGGTWVMTGLSEDEIFNQDAFTALLTVTTSLRMTSPIGKDVQDSFGMNAPQATVTLRVLEPEATSSTASSLSTDLSGTTTPVPTATPQMVEKEYTILIGATLDDGVVAKASNSDYYVYISPVTADNFITKTRENFITPPEATATPTPSPTLEATATPEVTNTPEASATPEASNTPEIVVTATPVPTNTPEATTTPSATHTPTATPSKVPPTATMAPTMTST
jgi:hypothetical protein